MGDAAEQFRTLTGIEKGHVDGLSADEPEVVETVEVEPTGQATVVETEVEDEDEDA